MFTGHLQALDALLQLTRSSLVVVVDNQPLAKAGSMAAWGSVGPAENAQGFDSLRLKPYKYAPLETFEPRHPDSETALPACLGPCNCSR